MFGVCRVTKMFSDALRSERAPLVSYYGAIAGLQVLSTVPAVPFGLELRPLDLTTMTLIII